MPDQKCKCCFNMFPENITSHPKGCEINRLELSFFPPFQLSLLAVLECFQRQQVMLEEKVYNNLYFLSCGAKKTSNVGFIVLSTLRGI